MLACRMSVVAKLYRVFLLGLLIPIWASFYTDHKLSMKKEHANSAAIGHYARQMCMHLKEKSSITNVDISGLRMKTEYDMY